MADDDSKVGINPGWAFGQLMRALALDTPEAKAKAEAWLKTLEGMAKGTLNIGSRTPVANTPGWVTLQVLHGGFASGNLAAGGPLQAHETEKLAALGAGGESRGPLNLYYVSDAGRAELLKMLAEGTYRIGVPEEGALVLAAWLVDQGRAEVASGLVDQLVPHFETLRFYPVPNAVPMRRPEGVFRWPVAGVQRELRARQPQAQVETMREALTVWTPLYDETVALFLETTDDGDDEAVGTPGARFPDDWAARARGLLDRYAEARKTHLRSKEPDHPKSYFFRLRAFLAVCLEGPLGLDPRDAGRVQHILRDFVRKRGRPGSPAHAATRRLELTAIAQASHADLARLLADRLRTEDPYLGLPDLEARLGPVTDDEARAWKTPEGDALPAHLVERARRCQEAPLEALVELGIVHSSEGLALLVPQLTRTALSTTLEGTGLAPWYEAEYLAFRQRRSLLLLDLDSQTWFGELPWVKAMSPWLQETDESRGVARAQLTDVLCLVLQRWPQTILPNRLVKELRTLARAAAVDLPLVDEIAADIFMGAFSGQFVDAAKRAGARLEGSLYARYYGVDYAAVLAFPPPEKDGYDKATSVAFARMCQQRAGADSPRGWSTVYNQTILEQAQILTTHGLAPAFDALGLETVLGPELPELARRTFEYVCAVQQAAADWGAAFGAVKKAGYAWRQLLFYLSLSDESAVQGFRYQARRHLGAQDKAFAARFAPVLTGLEAILDGGTFDDAGVHEASGGRRFLAWSTDGHWLVPPRESFLAQS